MPAHSKRTVNLQRNHTARCGTLIFYLFQYSSVNTPDVTLSLPALQITGGVSRIEAVGDAARIYELNKCRRIWLSDIVRNIIDIVNFFIAIKTILTV